MFLGYAAWGHIVTQQYSIPVLSYLLSLPYNAV
jgi:hypothetical protein